MAPSRATARPSRRRRRAAVALALALLAALVAALVTPSLLTASGDRLAETDELLDEPAAEAPKDEAEAIAPEPEATEEPIEAAPPVAEAAPPPEPRSGGPVAGDREAGAQPASEREANRRASRKRRGARAAQASASGVVDIRNFAYSPREITVRVGDSVRWTNRDRDPHDAEASDGGFKTRVLQRGQADTVTFRNAGSFRYFCSLHPPSQFPDFTGTVRVVAAGEGAGGGAGATGDPASGAGAGGAVGADDQAGTAAQPGDRAGAGSGLPATGLALLPLIALGVALVSTGALVRRFRRTDRGAAD